MLNNDPDWDPELFAGKTPPLLRPLELQVRERGARRARRARSSSTPTPSAGYPWQVVQTSWTGEQFELPREGEPRLQVAGWATEDAARKLVGARRARTWTSWSQARQEARLPAGAARRHARRSRSRTSLRSARPPTCSACCPAATRARATRRSSTPRITITSASAPPDASGDAIYNGALDNASGVALVLADRQGVQGAARAAAPLDPVRRSSAAEEQGLLGSQYYAAAPDLRRAGRIAANINFDGGNIRGRTKRPRLHRPRQVRPRRRGRRGRAVRRAARSRATSSPIAASSTAPTSSTSRRSACPRSTSSRGTDVIGRPPGGASEQAEVYTREDYHQPSRRVRPSVELRRHGRGRAARLLLRR